MREIAIYGKGGIGKSTVSANLSAALSRKGRRVLQIGCDPKHDSTHLLTHGAKQTTALDYMRVTIPPDYRIEDILVHGFGGVGCVEAGGPKPGVGCAGRGIISTFEILDQFRLKENYEYIIYDVLGDVVCGGFAVPIRREYADAIFIVTSGEFMALYAANNILRGIKNYDDERRRVAGIIYNKRNIEGEDERVSRFAGAVGLPVCAKIPRSDAFTKAERAKMTVIEHDGECEVSGIFTRLAGQISEGLELFAAAPLSDDVLEAAVLGKNGSTAQTVTAGTEPYTKSDIETGTEPYTEFDIETGTELLIDPENTAGAKEKKIAGPEENRYMSKNVARGEPLHGCAFNGAMSLCVHIKGAVVLAHSPKSCAFITYQTISSTGRRSLFERGALMPVSIAPNLECTDMGDTEVVFGGMEKLEGKVREIVSRSPRAVIAISACPAGIIGDDIDRIRSLSEPDIPVVTIKADGNMSGDFLQGMFSAYTSLARQVIKRDIPVIPNTVNIVAEKIIVTNADENFDVINGFLSRMGVRVNCRFIYDTNFDALRDFCSASLNLLAYKDYAGDTLEKFLTNEFGCKFFDRDFPVGFSDTSAWLRLIAGFFGCNETAEDIISENKERYEREVMTLRQVLCGKKLMIITYNHELDWILQTALDIGIKIVKIGLLNYSQDEGFRTRLTVPLPVEDKYDSSKRAEDVAKYRPDILLTNYYSSLADEVSLADTIPMCPDVGFFSGLIMAKRWARLIKLDQKGEWKQDERLLKKYFA